jgi:hypothetical protein
MAEAAQWTKPLMAVPRTVVAAMQTTGINANNRAYSENEVHFYYGRSSRW